MAQKMAVLQNSVTRLLNHRFYLVIWCLSSETHFGAVSVKFLLNRIAAQKMTNLQNNVRRLVIIVVRFSYNNPYHHSVTLKLLL